MNYINSDASKQHNSMLAYKHENEHKNEHEPEDKNDEEYETESIYEQTNQMIAEEMCLAADEESQKEMDQILHARSFATEAKAKAQIMLQQYSQTSLPTSTFRSTTMEETANPGIIYLKPTESTSAAGESLSGDEHTNADNALAHFRDRTDIYSRELGVGADACADPNDEYLDLFISTSWADDDHVSCLHVHSKSFDEDDNNRYINSNSNCNDNLSTFQYNNNTSKDTIASEIQMMQAILLAERACK